MVNSQTLARTVLELQTKPEPEKHIEAFINYLKENNLIGLLPQVIDHIGRITERQEETQTLHIASKHELSSHDIQTIQSITGASDAPVETHINKDIIGGFSASYEGYLYDGSLEHQVSRLKDMLLRS
ncbi:hypothetical protein CL684_02510 [Candidatus Campbellbacteria bacterium]|nr:hypothetical protein [Candidatus Campbellbacteria bacterium]|tara:strand:- start:612 stop:992 length:381 start_codon:yes stop_codon:yes gene_type:complete